MISASVILFDFDGVIMDSMDLKLDSYMYALEEFSFQRNRVSAIQERLAGLSRTKVISLILEELKGSIPTSEELTKYTERFEEHDRKQVSKMKLLDGTLKYLTNYTSEFYTAIVTGTPQKTIEEVLAFHNLSGFFNSVHGSPESKVNIVSRLQKSLEIQPDSMVFIGDGKTDQDAAIATGVFFIGYKNGRESFDSNISEFEISNLDELGVMVQPAPNNSLLRTRKKPLAEE